jgi:hypothetical protein
MSLVSIATPTFPGRETELTERCMPSVAGLDWLEVEQVIVSDRNPDIEAMVAKAAERLARPGYRVRVAQINESWRNPAAEASIGALPWRVASLMALGDWVGFLGDDDELLPDHARRHIAAMEAEGSDFSVSVVEFRAHGQHNCFIGDASFAHSHLDATGVMCRASALAVANWEPNGEVAADWRIVRDWQAAGLRGSFLGGTHTGIHHDGWVIGKTGRPDRPR